MEVWWRIYPSGHPKSRLIQVVVCRMFGSELLINSMVIFVTKVPGNTLKKLSSQFKRKIIFKRNAFENVDFKAAFIFSGLTVFWIFSLFALKISILQLGFQQSSSIWTALVPLKAIQYSTKWISFLSWLPIDIRLWTIYFVYLLHSISRQGSIPLRHFDANSHRGIPV